MTGSSLMAQRLSNPFVDQEISEQQKPGPILSNGKRIKIKDMTKRSKKKKERLDSQNSGQVKRSKGDVTASKKKDKKVKKK